MIAFPTFLMYLWNKFQEIVSAACGKIINVSGKASDYRTKYLKEGPTIKNYEHPEFAIFRKLSALSEKQPENKELEDVVVEVKKIINENAICLVQYASMYALLGDGDELSPTTKEKLAEMFDAAGKMLKGDKSP